jgi:hypothetical protein
LADIIIPAVVGQITGIRWRFPDTLPGGNVIGLLYDYSTGTELARATFSSPTAGDWNTVAFAAPVATSAIYYLAAIWTPDRYVATSGFFASSGLTNGNLTSPQDTPSDHNGQYAAGASPALPTSSFNSTSYFVDVLFDPAGAVADSITISDTVTRTLAAPRATADGITAVDTVAGNLAGARNPTDTLALADLAAASALLPRAGSESLAVTDTPARTATLTRSPADAMAITDTATGTIAPAGYGAPGRGAVTLLSRTGATLR